ncbi:MAG: hypothetical protein ABIP51_16765 [Bacteroidia bacterium]
MNLIDKILLEAKNIIDFNLLQKQVMAFREGMEENNDWSSDKECFKGTCQDETKYLEKYLKEIGYNAIRTRGYYSGAGDDFWPNASEWDERDCNIFRKQHSNNNDSSNGLKFPHWWVEIDNKIIIDVTEDQFHPGDENNYRVGIYKKPNSDYKKG